MNFVDPEAESHKDVTYPYSYVKRTFHAFDDYIAPLVLILQATFNIHGHKIMRVIIDIGFASDQQNSHENWTLQL